jgi:hypothetical protein
MSSSTSSRTGFESIDFVLNNRFQLSALLEIVTNVPLGNSKIQYILTFSLTICNMAVRYTHGGGWSRKINARYLHTLMVYL